MKRVLLAALFACAACPEPKPVSDQGVAVDRPPMVDGPFFERCRTTCVRPGDCQIAYPNDEVCPPGFRCSFTFACTADAGP